MKNLAIFNLSVLMEMVFYVCAQAPSDWHKYTPSVSIPYYNFNHQFNHQLPTQAQALHPYQNTDQYTLHRDAVVSALLRELKETKNNVENLKKEMTADLSNMKNQLAEMKKLTGKDVEAERLRSALNEILLNVTEANNYGQDQTTIPKAEFENVTMDYNDKAIPTARCGNCLILAGIVGLIGKNLIETRLQLGELTTKFEESISPTTIGQMPKSCADLKQLAYRKSGIFSVMGNQRVEKVYCDFTKQTGETGFQKLIGIIDVKSMRVSFHAQRTTPSTFNTVDTTIPFEVVKLNEGNAMDSTTGIFTAPTPGTYFFAFTGLSSASKSARVEFQVKTATVDWSTIGRAYGAQSDAETFALDAIVQLSKGDQIRLFLKTGEIENFGEHNTNFVGLLLEEVLG